MPAWPKKSNRPPSDTAGKLTEEAARTLQAKGVENPRLSAELLLAFATGKKHLDLRAFPDMEVPPEQAEKFRGYISLKAEGLPVEHITGKAFFLSLELNAGPSVLSPRPETEGLVLLAEEWIKAKRIEAPRILDIGTGSGCIACALALEFPAAAITACDISPLALETAKGNASALGLANIGFMLSDAALDINARFDVIVSNPPYIPTGEIAGLQKEVLRDPVSALDGGPDGLDIIRRIIEAAPSKLEHGGALFLETGLNQPRKIVTLLKRDVWPVSRIHKDMQDVERYVFAQVN